jgi:hypothetical protein
MENSTEIDWDYARTCLIDHRSDISTLSSSCCTATFTITGRMPMKSLIDLSSNRQIFALIQDREKPLYASALIVTYRLTKNRAADQLNN